MANGELEVAQAIGERPDELLPGDSAIVITIAIGAQLLIYRPVQGQEFGPLLVAVIPNSSRTLRPAAVRSS